MAHEGKVGLLSRAVAAQLRRTRAERGWTQHDLADAITTAADDLGDPDRAMSRAVIVAIEQEQRPVRLDEIPAICQALGMRAVQITETGQDIDPAAFAKIRAVTQGDRAADHDPLDDDRLIDRIRELVTSEVDQRIDRALRDRLTAIAASLTRDS